MLAPLRHRAFRLLFAGQVVSNLGDWLDLLALLGLIAYQWRLGAPALAALTLMLLLPRAVVAPVAGVFVDRWPRRLVMIVCDLARAALALCLVWAPNVVAALAIVLAMSVLSTFFDPARQAAIRVTVPEEDLLQASALSRLSVNVTKVLGPAAGGVVVALAGPRAAFVVDALTFVVSAALLSRLRLQGESRAAKDPNDPGPSRIWQDLREGVAYMLGTRVLLIAVGFQMVEMLIIESNDSLSVLAFMQVGMGEALVGLAIGCSGLGNVGGALGIGQWGGRLHPLRQMGAGKLLIGTIEAALGTAIVLGLRGGADWFPVLVLGGVGFAAIWVPFSYIVQRETPPQLTGRVSATAGALCTTFGLAGPPLGAFLAQRIGVGPLFVVTGGAVGVLGLALLLLPMPPLSERHTETARDGQPA